MEFASTTFWQHIRPWAKRAREATVEATNVYRASQHAPRHIGRRALLAWRRSAALSRVRARAELRAETHVQRRLRWKARLALKMWRVMTRGATYRRKVDRAEDARAAVRREAVLARRWGRRWIAAATARREDAATTRRAEVCRRRLLGKLRSQCFDVWWHAGVVRGRKLRAIHTRSIERQVLAMVRGWRVESARAPTIRAEGAMKVAAAVAAEVAAENRAAACARRISTRRLASVLIDWREVASIAVRHLFMTKQMVRRHILAGIGRAARAWQATAAGSAIKREVAAARVAAKHRRHLLSLVLIDGWRTTVASLREKIQAIDAAEVRRNTRAMEHALSTWRVRGAQRRSKTNIAHVTLRWGRGVIDIRHVYVPAPQLACTDLSKRCPPYFRTTFD